METKKSFSEFAQFEFNRINDRMVYRSRGIYEIPALRLVVEDEDDFLTLKFCSSKTEQSVAIPVPYKNEVGNLVVNREVARAVGSWFLVDKEKEVGYWGLMRLILAERIDGYFSHLPGVGKRSQIEKVMVSFRYNRPHRAVNNLQRVVNDVVNRLPLCNTPMQTWAMCNRVVFLDPEFDDSMTPEKILEYQKEKNHKYFPWTMVGLSDSTMIKNYMLKEDLRNYTPFGKKHHSPMRNLYQSLGMKGPDTPLVRTRATSLLEEKGIHRGCWNWFTAFIDLPLNFEDQLMLHTDHQDKVSVSEASFLSFGTVAVTEGEEITKGSILAMEPGSKALIFRCDCENAKVTKIEKTKLGIGGETVDVTVITAELKRVFKNGFKFTNLHGNKGVAVFCDTGTAYDPIRKVHRRIDVVVSAKTVGNRRNFGQLLEALTTLVNGPNKRLTISDDYCASIEKIKSRLVSAGGPEDGAIDICTAYGDFKAVCGWVAWGLLKEPESAVWDRSDVSKVNTIGIRESGSKVSPIEFRALTTIFGPDNAVTREILDEQEGSDLVEEFTKIVESSVGITHDGPETSCDSFSIPTRMTNFVVKRAGLAKTVSDTNLYKNGVYLKLPVDYYTVEPKDKKYQIRSVTTLPGNKPQGINIPCNLYKTNVIYIPAAELREPWQHRCGLWGTSETSEYINNILRTISGLEDNKTTLVDVGMMLTRYFSAAAKKLSTKRGLIATHCLSVRYPKSAKATATMSDKLPSDVVEIHRAMANDLRVSDGDYVIIERFPCLGFLSMRVQQVKITNDDLKRFVITVSGSSLNSTGLDFDGDTLHVLAFHTPKAKAELELAFRAPNPKVKELVDESRLTKQPRIWQATLDDFACMGPDNGQPQMTFSPLTPEVQAEIVGALTSIKTGTGTSVAFGYNLCRITERCLGYNQQALNASVEALLDQVANSVFKVKHGINALLERKTEC